MGGTSSLVEEGHPQAFAATKPENLMKSGVNHNQCGMVATADRAEVL